MSSPEVNRRGRQVLTDALELPLMCRMFLYLFLKPMYVHAEEPQRVFFARGARVAPEFVARQSPRSRHLEE